jgi:hypothetical protein
MESVEFEEKVSMSDFLVFVAVVVVPCVVAHITPLADGGSKYDRWRCS